MSAHMYKHKSHKAVSHSLQAVFCSVCHSQDPGRSLAPESQAHTGELLLWWNAKERRGSLTHRGVELLISNRVCNR